MLLFIYSKRADIVQVDTWTCASGRNGMRRDWLGRDYKTGKTLFRAVRLETSYLVYILITYISNLYLNTFWSN